jgi:four helix bundle protein
MLRIHNDMLEAIATMRPLLGSIERRDTDLARQLRRAAASVALNIAE